MCDMCNNVCINKIPNSFAIKSRNEHHKRYAYLFQIYNIFICILYERTHILLHIHYTLHTTYTPRKHEIRFEIATLVPIYILIEVKIETKHQKRDKIIIVYYDVSVILWLLVHTHTHTLVVYCIIPFIGFWHLVRISCASPITNHFISNSWFYIFFLSIHSLPSSFLNCVKRFCYNVKFRSHFPLVVVFRHCSNRQ